MRYTIPTFHNFVIIEMANESDTNWERPWSMDEIIDNADNWSLAGDAALLNTIKAFADNLLTKTVALSSNVENLLDNLHNVGLKLDISQNEFQSLRNTQFIESRVYEDDETLYSKEEVKVKKKEATDEEKDKLIRESIQTGLEVMDKYFNKVEVSISDSEEESDKSYVLQAKDMYGDRLLPLLIGSEKWYKKWHVGLIESSSESESEKVSEIYSDSDSEDDLPKDFIKGSETSSELDFSSRTSENRPVANSTFNDSVKRPDIFDSSDESEEQPSLPVKTPISSKNFAEQLAAKLGSVISQQEDISPEVNRKPIQPPQSNKYMGDLFADQPPPLDDLEDTILPKGGNSSLFSGGQGLFDDNNDDELFWGQQSKPPPASQSALFDDEGVSETSRSINKNTTLLPKSSQVSKGLFDSDDSSDDDIFTANKKQLSKQPFLQPFKTTAPLFDEEPPELNPVNKSVEKEPVKKKPTGGVSIFGSSNIIGHQNIQDVLKNQQKTSLGKQHSEEEPRTEENKETSQSDGLKPKQTDLFDDDLDAKVEPPKQKTKKISLFDDDDDLFKEDLFSNITSRKFTSNLFDDIDNTKDLYSINASNNNTPKSDIFGALDNKKIYDPSNAGNKAKKVVSLFSDNDEEEEEGLFGDSLLTNKGNNISDDVTTDIANNNSINMDAERERNSVLGVTKVEESVGHVGYIERGMAGAEYAVSSLPNNAAKGLFDDYEDEGPEDLFKVVGRKESDLFKPLSDREVGKAAAQEKSDPALPRFEDGPSTLSQKASAKSTVSLFDSTPPPVDDDWDTRSDNFSDTEDQFAYGFEDNTARSSLFDNEPPSLGPNESSGIVRDHSVTRVDTDTDSSFYPYASSSRRLSSDIFSDEQSQDRLFVTRNKTESITGPPNLDVIPEVSKTSNVDITPSGDPQDFEDATENESTNNSVFDRESTLDGVENTPKKTISLFDDEDKGIVGSEDLFSSKVKLFDNVDSLSEKNTCSSKNDTNESNNDGDKSAHVGDGEGNFEKSEVDGVISAIKGDVKNKIASITEKLQNETEKEVPKQSSGSPGKLKHNLNINVSALMPGSAMPKLPKSHSLEMPKDVETPISPSFEDFGSFTPRKSESDKRLADEDKQTVSFEDAVDNVEVLHSITKDRAKIPIKRRPSTRRGRQEAIRKSVIDLSLENESGATPSEEILNQEAASKNCAEDVLVNDSKGSVAQEALNNSNFVPVTKKDIMTNGAHKNPETSNANSILDTNATEEKTTDTTNSIQNLEESLGSPKPKDRTNLFGADGLDGIFDSPTKKASVLFDSGESDNDLFAPSMGKSSKRGSVKAEKKSLFNDSSSDDELFAAAANVAVRKKDSVLKSSEKKSQKASNLRKLENIEGDDDPLSCLLK